MFSKSVPYEVVADDIIRRLLTPLQAQFPDLVQAVIQALGGNRMPERAGQALLAGLQTWMEKFQAEIQSYKQTSSDLRDTIDKQQTEIRDLRSQLEKIKQEMEELEGHNEYLENTISLQNTILAKQHEQLMRLLSSTPLD